MRKPDRVTLVLENVEIIDAGSEGMGVGKVNDRVVFVPFVVPGDIVDVQVIRKKKNYLEGKVVRFHKYSDKRIEAHCSHFGLCGGCRWQNMKYDDQLFYKQKQVTDNLQRIGKLLSPDIRPIIPSPLTRYYRNKLEYTFSNRRWLTDGDRAAEAGTIDTNGVGFHIPQLFDRIVDVQECFHQADPSNQVRNTLKSYAIEHGLSFYDARNWEGFLRNVIIRTTTTGGVMVILVVRDENIPVVEAMLDHLVEQVPAITSVYYVINPKKNDTLYDLPYVHYRGDKAIIEKMQPYREGGREISFVIGPSSFFQTNSVQAETLYRIAADFGGFRGDETVYDLYTGTGTIANYIAPYVLKVIGIETVSEAISDAEVNAAANGLDNTVFFPGEVEKILTPAFFKSQGKPDIIITDPPRSGMHEKVINAILDAAPPKVVYVSCNPATQARDIALLSVAYDVAMCQPVDMFPHTQHVENVALLVKKEAGTVTP
jgi:23S rRNA (uracil1939-C5)-methyltransferase